MISEKVFSGLMRWQFLFIAVVTRHETDGLLEDSQERGNEGATIASSSKGRKRVLCRFFGTRNGMLSFIFPLISGLIILARD